MDWDYWKHLLVGTPFETAAARLAELFRVALCLKHPEWFPLQAETALTERLYARVLERDSNCIDVGAHLGRELSRFRRFAPQGKHMAFEPVPRKANWLKAKFPEVEVHSVALGDRNTSAMLYVNLSDGARSALTPRLPSSQGWRRIGVSKVRLDDVIGDEWVDFLRIHVEGHELGVLSGASRVLARCRPYVLFESTKSGLTASGRTVREVYRWFEARNYGIYTASDFLHDGWPLEFGEFERSHEYPFRAVSFLGVPLERAVRTRPLMELTYHGVRPQA